MAEKNRPTGSRARKIVWGLVAVMAAMTALNFLVYLMGDQEKTVQAPAVPVDIEPARKSMVVVELIQSADLRPRREVFIVPKIKGQHLRDILVERGDKVLRGQLLIKLDEATVRARQAEIKAGLREAQASKDAAEANLHVLDKDLVRLQRLTKTGAAAQQELDHIMAKHKAADAQASLAGAQIARARALLQQLDIAIGDHNITEPIDGLISARYQDVGSLSDDKKPLLRISDESTVKVLTTVGERDYPLVKLGQKGYIAVDAYPGRHFPATVTVINPSLDPATRSAEIELTIDNKDLVLRSGMYAEARLTLGQREAVLVPLAAVQRMPGTGVNFVFVIDDDKARQINVKAGEVFGGQREIRSGLSSGQMVVTRGGSRLVDGQAVTIAKAVE